MLIEPASKVSVPFTVVIRTRSNALPSDIPPAEKQLPLEGIVVVAVSVHIFALRFVIYITPVYACAATQIKFNIKPDVAYAPPDDALPIVLYEQSYPDTTILPFPSRI